MVLPYNPFFTPQLEVNSLLTQAVLEVHGNQKLEHTFYKQGIAEDKTNAWYNIQSYINILQEISSNSGPFGLFKLGKYIGQELEFPEHIQSLEEALNVLEDVFGQLHRNGEVGNYTLIKFDEFQKEAIIECKNPYPCYFDRGLLIKVARRFAPLGTEVINIELDNLIPSRLVGGDSSLYHILWL